MLKQVRLNKFLAESGISSRRGADELISGGVVMVNGKIAEVGLKIDPEKDEVIVAGKKVGLAEEKVYYILNKPVGYISTASDPHDRKKVTDLVPSNPRVYPVGRLDHDTSGLLILTNDGDFAYKMTHPKFEKEKEYTIVVKTTKKCPMPNAQCPIGESLRDIFLKGVKLEEGIAKADKISVLEDKGDVVKLSIVIHQGWNRQIRRMCDSMGLEVLGLKRVRIGDIKLGDLKEGEYKQVKKEIL